ncbi:hypothetical protein Aab01nite_61280 [Paractinoplanes abujensis]|nr:hypothetical protein Aab01nite_61280 [Actinoplanes abujensis]
MGGAEVAPAGLVAVVAGGVVGAAPAPADVVEVAGAGTGAAAPPTRSTPPEHPLSRVVAQAVAVTTARRDLRMT